MRLNRRLIVAFGLLFGCFVLVRIVWFSTDESEFVKRDSYESLRVNRVVPPAQQMSDDENNNQDMCYYDSSCPSPQILFRLHAETPSSPPFACLNDIRLFDNAHVGEGVNLVSINGTTGDIETSITIDVTASDEKLIEWLRDRDDSAVVIAVSFGDIAEHVSTDARSAFAVYGAKKINNWRGGMAYAIIGQRGLVGQAHEQLIPQSSSNSMILEGCFDLPLGELSYVNITETDVAEVHRVDVDLLSELGAANADSLPMKEVRLGEEWENCGLDHECEKDEISFHAFSGEHKEDFPRMCIGGRMVFDRGLNGAGRGLNIAAFEPKTGRIRAVGNYDTYEKDSNELETFLDSIPSGDVVAVVSFDEASTMLSEMAKQIFYEMGSSMIDRLKFRASWYFVGRKSITAYSPFEDLNIPQGNNWAKPIKKSACLPRTFGNTKETISHHKMGHGKNLPKRHFCVKHDKHDEFCSEKTIDSPIAPKLLSKKERKGDPIFNTPILIVAGLSTPSLLKCLESLMEQEGLNTQMILVAYDKEYPENAQLASLFHAKSLALNGTTSYNGLLLSSLTAVFSVFPDAPAVAVIEEDIILSPDWLWYLSQTLSTLLNDDKVEIVHTFNPNGFADTSSRPSVVYRSSYSPPMYSYMLSRTLFEKHIQNSSTCCPSSRLGRWSLRSVPGLVPEVSRISVQPPPAVPPLPWTVPAYFNRDRVHSTSSQTVLKGDFSSEDAYDKSIVDLLESATVVPFDRFNCDEWRTEYNDTRVLAVTCSDSLSELSSAAKCFHLYFDEKFVTGLYKRILRFFANNTTEVLIVPSNTISAFWSALSSSNNTI